MNDFVKTIKDVCSDVNVRKRVYWISLAAALLVLALLIRGPESKGVLLTDSDGNVTAIRRNSLENQEQYDIQLNIAEGGEILTRETTLTLRAIGSSDPGTDPEKHERENRDAEIDAEIDSMLTEIELSEEKDVLLPSSLSDGTKVKWRPVAQKDRSGLVLIPILYAALIAVVIYSHFNEDKTKDVADRKEIMKGLPRFCNQLFLMMNAGMILSDAFERICTSYMEYDPDDLTTFEKELTEISIANSDHRVSTAACISEFASRHNVKELVRIAAILTENEKRGSDIVENLARESSFLWDDRKIVAREQGKLIDTRMSWPLGLLLIMLIVITMAPALMNM